MKTQGLLVIPLATSLIALAAVPARAEVLAVEPPPPATAVCAQCGMIESIREVTQEGETTGIGTVAGGLLGGILGRELGDGGSFFGMLLGMAGGAYAGNKFEQYRNKVTRYEVSVRFDDGTQRLLTFDTRPTWQVGERVRLGSGGLMREKAEPRPDLRLGEAAI